MPARRRGQEWKRRYRKAAVEVEAQELADLRLALVMAEPADPFDDYWWRDHEQGEPYCCDLCSRNHPEVLLADARREIDDYLRRTT